MYKRPNKNKNTFCVRDPFVSCLASLKIYRVSRLIHAESLRQATTVYKQRAAKLPKPFFIDSRNPTLELFFLPSYEGEANEQTTIARHINRGAEKETKLIKKICEDLCRLLFGRQINFKMILDGNEKHHRFLITRRSSFIIKSEKIFCCLRPFHFIPRWIFLTSKANVWGDEQASINRRHA